MDVLSSTAVTTATAASKTTETSSDYQTFLKMLTTQLKYQDPMSPMESQEFAVQLATFSGVEQQTVTNQLLEKMGAKLDAMTLSDLSSWLGAEARVETPITVDGSGVTIYPQADDTADTAVLVVRDQGGAVVAREPISPSASSMVWMPSDATGNALTMGSYSLSTESYSGDVLLSTTAVAHYAKVTEARNGTDGTMLVLDNGTEVAASAVSSLRR
ncbi:flagellar hook capping FlgD N-terminal domain-containing protein [Falsirhodobacter sp. alg1]|uniref:flagellar hook capping FlgD N-terminal domain-containing protein n=1 Tax=Falsirhodobacter sp. alg1 TaxID=1472418 RepID=UPI0006947207|nr:flagellar hook capping FlgD N-terminal domain-containing protein [Falsirhodobacter sp. alg1]